MKRRVSGTLFLVSKGSWLDRLYARNQGSGYDIREVFAPHGNYVIRLEHGSTPSAARLVLASLLRFIFVPEWKPGWVVAVRKRRDDPDGPTVLEETFDTVEAGRKRLDELEKEVRAAPPPAR